MARVEVLYCPQPGVAESRLLDLPEPATLADALRGCGLLEQYGLHLPDVTAGIWARVMPHDTLLRAGDRVEVYRPLTVDPKEARRLRYKRHGKGARRGQPKDQPQRAAPALGEPDVPEAAGAAAGSVSGNPR